MQCGLCRADAEGEQVSAVQDAFQFECPRCGTYRVTRIALHLLKEWDDDQRRRLTWAARQASEHGAPLKLAQENIEDIARSIVEPHPPSRKLDLLLLLIGKRSAAFGTDVVLNSLRDWPLVFARGEAEFARLEQTLANATGWVTKHNLDLRLTQAGWQRFAQLEAEQPKSTSAFVAMRFNEEMEAMYDAAFYPTLHELGYDPIKVNREEYLGKIDDFIIASLRKSALLVADFTEMRPNVFFEAGFGLGLGIPVVWTCRKDWADKLGDHFDTRQYPHVIWSDAEDLKVKLRNRIEAAVVPRPRPRTD